MLIVTMMNLNELQELENALSPFSRVSTVSPLLGKSSIGAYCGTNSGKRRSIDLFYYKYR